MFSKDKHRPEESRVSGEFSDQTPKAQLIKGERKSMSLGIFKTIFSMF